MDSSSSASYHSFGSSDDHLLKQVEVMIANEEIYTPKSEIFISPCMIERENTVSKTSLETATVITSPPRSPTSVVLDDTTDTSSRETYPPTKKFKSRRAGGSGRLTSDIHREVCQWMYKVIDHYSLERKIVAKGMNFFVRYVSSSFAMEDQELSFELSTATSLYIAIKLFGGPKITSYGNDRHLLRSFAQMSNSRFDEQSIVQMEMKMLHVLSWYVHPSTPQDYVPYFTAILNHDHKLDKPSTSALIDLSNYILELVVFKNQFSFINPSSLACAAIAIAKRGLSTNFATADGKEHSSPFVFLQPLLSNGLLSLNVIRGTMDYLDSYLEEISPMLVDDDDLGIDITRVLFKHSVFIPEK